MRPRKAILYALRFHRLRSSEVELIRGKFRKHCLFSCKGYRPFPAETYSYAATEVQFLQFSPEKA